MATVPLSESANVELDGSGNGTTSVGPTGNSETWNIQRVHVKTNQVPASIVNEALCSVYSGPQVADQYYVDGTSSGSTGDSTDSADAYPLGKGQYIWAVWAGGDAGAEGIVRVTGTKDI